MNITILRKMEYEGQFIYIAQFATTFQYLFAVEQDIYQNHIEFKPSFKNLILWKLGRIKTPYTPDQLDEGEQVILSGAMETIDKLKEEGKFTRQGKKSVVKKIERIREERAAKKDIKCQWQTTETTDGWYYSCLVHGQAVKLKDDEKPFHD